jgi:delta14-sterol reductase
MRPGLLGWIVLDLAFVAHQCKRFDYVTGSIILITGSQEFYVLDALYMEPAILTTIDIISDGFGFMLAVAGTAWVPFSYSLEARYLSTYPLPFGPETALAIVALGFGYYIFRASNNDKKLFRTNPNDPAISHLKYMETKSGS